MRVILAVGAFCSAMGASVQFIRGNFTFAVILAALFALCSLLFLGYISGSRKLDRVLEEVRRDEDRHEH